MAENLERHIENLGKNAMRIVRDIINSITPTIDNPPEEICQIRARVIEIIRLIAKSNHVKYSQISNLRLATELLETGSYERQGISEILEEIALAIAERLPQEKRERVLKLYDLNHEANSYPTGYQPLDNSKAIRLDCRPGAWNSDYQESQNNPRSLLKILEEES